MNISKRTKQILAGTFILMQVTSLTGCNNKSNTAIPESTPTHATQLIYEEIDPIQQTENKMIEFLNTLSDKTSTIQNTYQYYEEHMDEIEDYNNPKYDDIRVEYAIASFHDIKEEDIEEVASALNSLMILQLNPTDNFSQEFWEEQFQPLLNHLQEQESLYSKYFPLAWLTHQYACLNTHQYTEWGSTYCPTLEKQYTLKYEKRTIT